IPNGFVIPVLFARLCADTSLVKAATHRVDRAALLTHPSKHLLHDASFVKNNLKTGFSTSFLLVYVAITVGCMAEDTDASLLGSMTLSSSAPFEEFCSLVFGNHPLNLQQ